MIRISHKSVYSLIEEHYVRKTLKGVITDIDLSTFRMAQVFALTNEDFEFMNVMQEDLNQYDKDYALFVNYEAAEVIALESKDEFTFIEVIGLSIMLKEVIPLQKFKEVIHSQASGNRFAIVDDKTPEDIEQMFADMRQEIIQQHLKHAAARKKDDPPS